MLVLSPYRNRGSIRYALISNSRIKNNSIFTYLIYKNLKVLTNEKTSNTNISICSISGNVIFMQCKAEVLRRK